MTLTLLLVSVLALNRLDDYFLSQQRADLSSRLETVGGFSAVLASRAAALRPVVHPDGTLDPAVAARFNDPDVREILADQLGQANVRLVFGLLTPAGFQPASNGTVALALEAEPHANQAPENLEVSSRLEDQTAVVPWAVDITLSNPYTFRAQAVQTLIGLLFAIGLFALGLAIIVAAGLARRYTAPLRRLTEASRALAEGDLASRVPVESLNTGSSELTALGTQFNAMAERLEESVTIIRSDRDRSRDFLADVSHELRTPIAALRTFNELLKEHGSDDPAARVEFLDASGQQLERLDWLAQNLLELSKLDSGLVLLDLRPDDLRAAVESAVEQAEPVARRRGVTLSVSAPGSPIRIRHDPQRIGQVVANLVGNAIKFTPSGGSVNVDVRPWRDGARIDVQDTGVGIDASELPKIFERFFRGSQANEARGSGSGLGLAIVRSIVDMHHGTVAVESRLGSGSTFTVILPRDPRAVEDRTDAGDERLDDEDDVESLPAAANPAPRTIGNMVETSPTEAARLNPDASS